MPILSLTRSVRQVGRRRWDDSRCRARLHTVRWRVHDLASTTAGQLLLAPFVPVDRAAAHALQRKLEEQAAWDELARIDYWFHVYKQLAEG